MKGRRLYARIYLHFIGVLIVVGIVSSLVFATGWRATFLRTWTMRLAHHAASMVAAQPDEAHRQGMVRHLSEELDLEITVRDRSGRVQIAAGNELPALSADEIRQVSEGPNIFHHDHAWFAAAPIFDHGTGTQVGVLQIYPMRRFAPPSMFRPLAMVALGLLIVGLATFPLARRISRPVERLTEASRRLGGGELSYRVPLQPRGRHRWRRHHRHHHRPDDELGELTRAWNDMAERVENLVRGQRELLANVSHELRSPLARIRLALELLPADGKTAARVSDVKIDLAELERLIDDVLTTSRLDATGLPTHLDKVDVPALLAQLVERAQIDPLTAGTKVELAPGSDGAGVVHADGALLKRAVWNLVENAAKYGASPIVLSATRSSDRLALTVADQGDGIPLADRERVFDPFYRADKARTPGRTAGFGLGLTLARRVAEVHGGTIQITDGEPRGCRITVEIPLDKR